MNKNKKRTWFIVLVSTFATLWVASLVFLGFSTLSENITNSIESWYATKFEEKTLDLFKVSSWSTILTTCALMIVLLAKELKKKYLTTK